MRSNRHSSGFISTARAAADDAAVVPNTGLGCRETRTRRGQLASWMKGSR